MTRRLFCLDFDHCDDRKIGLRVILTQKLIFDLKHLKNYDKPIHGLKKPKKIIQKTKLVSKPKINSS
jgi:hypothetical protein